MAKTNFQTVDEYIAAFPEQDREELEGMRQTIKDGVPDAEEVISYQIPAFKYHGMLIYFSAYKDHFSLSFPPPFTVFEVFKDELAPFKVSKSAINIPKATPMSSELLRRLVEFRARENLESAKAKQK